MRPSCDPAVNTRPEDTAELTMWVPKDRHGRLAFEFKPRTTDEEISDAVRLYLVDQVGPFEISSIDGGALLVWSQGTRARMVAFNDPDGGGRKVLIYFDVMPPAGSGLGLKFCMSELPAGGRGN